MGCAGLSHQQFSHDDEEDLLCEYIINIADKGYGLMSNNWHVI